MSDTKKIEVQARLLQLVLEKHPAQANKDRAFKLMQQAEKGSEEFKAYAALYELMDVFTNQES